MCVSHESVHPPPPMIVLAASISFTLSDLSVSPEFSSRENEMDGSLLGNAVRKSLWDSWLGSDPNDHAHSWAMVWSPLSRAHHGNVATAERGSGGRPGSCSVREQTEELVGTERKDQIVQLSAGGVGAGDGKAANTPAKSARKSDKDGRDSGTTGRRVGRENDGRDKAE